MTIHTYLYKNHEIHKLAAMAECDIKTARLWARPDMRARTKAGIAHRLERAAAELQLQPRTETP
jgi:hypothetical protein